MHKTNNLQLTKLAEKICLRGKQFWMKKRKEIVKLCHVILNRRSCQQYGVGESILGAQHLHGENKIVSQY